jgi:hypothetical protein
MEYFNTFGGNAARLLEALEVVLGESPLKNS